jgi:tetratricopeptide (TPR) repeat protein
MKSKKPHRPAGSQSPTQKSQKPIPVGPLQSLSTNDSQIGSKRHFLAALALCLLPLLCYSNSFSTGFPLDNKALLLQDPRIREASQQNISSILQHSYWWPVGEAGLYRPLTTFSYLFNYAILGNHGEAAGYHWLNLGLHAATALLVFGVLLVLVRQFWPSFFIAALWAVHPVSTESVTNIAGRSDLLAAIGVLGGFLLYVKGADQSGWRRIACFSGLMISTAIGVFSKESAVTIAAVIALYELLWWKERRQVRGLLWASIAVLPPIALMLVQRHKVLASSPPADWPFTDNPIIGAGFLTGHLTAVKVMAHYLGLAVWPMRLSCDYSYSQIPLVRGTAEDWIACLLVAAIAIAVIFLYRWNRMAFFFALFAALTFLPTSNLLFPIGAIMADRFLYLPLAGLLACAVLCASALVPRGRARIAGSIALAVVIAAFSIRTWLRNADWQNDLTLSTADLRSSPRSFKLHALRAAALLDADPSHSNIDEVIQEADRSVAILDSLPDLRNAPNVYESAGEAHLIKGDLSRKSGFDGAGTLSDGTRESYQTARELLARSIRINKAYQDRVKSEQGGSLAVIPRSLPAAYNQLSAVNLRLGDLDAALAAAEQARALAPFEPIVYRQLASVYAAQQRGDEALTMLMKGLLITSDSGLRANLVQIFASNHDPSNCTLVPGRDGPSMNPRCKTIQNLVCAASVDVLKARLRSGARAQAQKEKQNFLHDYGCATAPLNQVLPDGF